MVHLLWLNSLGSEKTAVKILCVIYWVIKKQWTRTLWRECLNHTTYTRGSKALVHMRVTCLFLKSLMTGPHPQKFWLIWSRMWLGYRKSSKLPRLSEYSVKLRNTKWQCFMKLISIERQTFKDPQSQRKVKDFWGLCIIAKVMFQMHKCHYEANIIGL